MRRRGRRDVGHGMGASASRRGFHRSVVRLLERSGLNSTEAVRLMVRWYRVVDRRWQDGKSAENVAGHLLKYQKQGVVCPCARRRSWTSRDVEPRCALVDGGMNLRGTSNRARDLARKGRRGDVVVCRSYLPWKMVNARAVRDPGGKAPERGKLTWKGLTEGQLEALRIAAVNGPRTLKSGGRVLETGLYIIRIGHSHHPHLSSAVRGLKAKGLLRGLTSGGPYYDSWKLYALTEKGKELVAALSFAKAITHTRRDPRGRRALRDPEEDREIRTFTTKALLRLLSRAEASGDDRTVRRIERELDRRGKGF